MTGEGDMLTLEQAKSIIDKMTEREQDAARRELLAKFKDNCALVDVRERFGMAINDFVK
jgi:hypothetical protein